MVTDKIYSVILKLIRIIFILCIIKNIFIKNYFIALVALSGILLTLSPFIISKILNHDLSCHIKIFIILFIFIALYLGSIHNFYSFKCFDTFLHFSSGVMLSFIADNWISIEYKKTDIKKFSLFFTNVFTISFAVFCGVVWEIYEFSMDTFFNLDMQRIKAFKFSDTMIDLIADLSGALLFILIKYIYNKKKRKNLT